MFAIEFAVFLCEPQHNCIFSGHTVQHDVEIILLVTLHHKFGFVNIS